MCGIAGFVESSTHVGAVRRDTSRALVHRMCDVIRHRGPDDEGVWVDEGVALGMRRLSIIDLSTGHQPIHNEDRSVWIVFNGEIYNFRELRRELEAAGHRFYTSTDTEVIVHAYEQWGTDAIARLRGMFGLAIWDTRTRTLARRARSHRHQADALRRRSNGRALLRIRDQVAARRRRICRAISIRTRSITTCRFSTRRATARSSRACASCRPATC